MLLIADSGVWIDYFNGRETPPSDFLDTALAAGSVATGDLIMLEVLQGFRHDKDYRAAKQAFAALDQYELFGHGMLSQCADNFRTLRKAGITIRRTADVIIATFCIEHQIPLLFSDRDFLPFVERLGLVDALGLEIRHDG